MEIDFSLPTGALADRECPEENHLRVGPNVDVSPFFPVDPKQLAKELVGVEWPAETGIRQSFVALKEEHCWRCRAVRSRIVTRENGRSLLEALQDAGRYRERE
jgi:hypothetical protein